jgi:hypothetical protein
MDVRDSNLPKDNIVINMNKFDSCVIVVFENICYIFLYVYTSGSGAIKEFDNNSKNNKLKVLNALTKANFKELGLDIKFVNKFVAVVNGFVDAKRPRPPASTNVPSESGSPAKPLKGSESVHSNLSGVSGVSDQEAGTYGFEFGRQQPSVWGEPGHGARMFEQQGLRGYSGVPSNLWRQSDVFQPNYGYGNQPGYRNQPGWGGSRKKINNYKILNNLILILSKINKVKNLTKIKATKPTKPKATKPTKPKATKSTKPKTTKLTKPKATKSTKPKATKLTKPKATKPTKPKATKPTKPKATKLTKPEVTKPKATKKI